MQAASPEYGGSVSRLAIAGGVKQVNKPQSGPYIRLNSLALSNIHKGDTITF